MQRMVQLPAFLAVTVLLFGCAVRQPVLPTETDTVAVETGTNLLSDNDRTPDTTDSLEVSAGTSTVLEYTLSTSGTIVVGNPEAPRLIIFSDYDCTYCRQFLTTDFTHLETTFIASNRLSVEHVFVPMTKNGEAAARLAVCAAEQHKFPEADLWLWANPIAGIDTKLFAKAINLNLKTLTACLARNNVLAGHVQKAAAHKVERVPFFVLGSDSWLGLLQKEELMERIDRALR